MEIMIRHIFYKSSLGIQIVWSHQIQFWLIMYIFCEKYTDTYHISMYMCIC